MDDGKDPASRRSATTSARRPLHTQQQRVIVKRKKKIRIIYLRMITRGCLKSLFTTKCPSNDKNLDLAQGAKKTNHYRSCQRRERAHFSCRSCLRVWPTKEFADVQGALQAFAVRLSLQALFKNAPGPGS